MRWKCCSVKSVMAQVRSVRGDGRQDDGTVGQQGLRAAEQSQLCRR